MAQRKRVAERTTDLLQAASHVHHLYHDLTGSLTEVTDQDGNITGRARYVHSANAPGCSRKCVWGGADEHYPAHHHRPPIQQRACPSLNSGCCANADAGLVYAGDGRFYDPALGLPLQPDSFGGVPVLHYVQDHLRLRCQCRWLTQKRRAR